MWWGVPFSNPPGVWRSIILNSPSGFPKPWQQTHFGEFLAAKMLLTAAFFTILVPKIGTN